MFSHLSVPKVNSKSPVPPSLSFLLEPPASPNFEVFPFFVNQVGTVIIFF